MQKMRRTPSRALYLLGMLVVVIRYVSVSRTQPSFDQCKCLGDGGVNEEGSMKSGERKKEGVERGRVERSG